jgi:hypothetical protein
MNAVPGSEAPPRIATSPVCPDMWSSFAAGKSSRTLATTPGPFPPGIMTSLRITSISGTSRAMSTAALPPPTANTRWPRSSSIPVTTSRTIGVVVDHEDGCNSVLAALGRRSRRQRRALCEREVHRERGAAAELSVEGHSTAALLDDSAHCRQPEPVALEALGGEERVEGPLGGLGVHSHPGVPDSENGLSGRQGNLDQQPAAARHRIACVEGEVRDHLFQLAPIRIDVHRRVGRGGHELDAFAENSPQELDHPTHDLSEVDDLRLEDLAFRERKQLPRQVARAIRYLQQVTDVGVGVRLPALEPAQGELAVAADADQQVVEVVCDPAGEAADRLEPLCLAQLLLQPHVLADVGPEAEDMPRSTGLVTHDHALALHRVHATFTGGNAKDERRISIVRPASARLEHPVAVVGMQHLEDEEGIVQPGSRRVSEHLLDMRAHVERSRAKPGKVDVGNDRELLDQLPEECVKNEGQVASTVSGASSHSVCTDSGRAGAASAG